LQKYSNIEESSPGAFKHIVAGAFFQIQGSCINRIEEINSLINGDILFIDVYPENVNHQLILSEPEREKLMEQLKVSNYLLVGESQWPAILKGIRRNQNCENSIYKGPYFLSGLTDTGIDYSITTAFLTRSFIDDRVFNWHDALGFYFPLQGSVVYGNKIGRTLGFPTINIQPNNIRKLIPPMGVYAGMAKIGNIWHRIMINIGIRPTLDMSRVTIEAHIFDYDEDIYGQSVSIHFIGRIRDEMRFSSLDILKSQLQTDKEKALAMLEKIDLNPSEQDEYILIR
jgi:hypothetical protein